MYDKNADNKRLGRKFLSEFLGFLKYKVDNDLLTLDEVEQMVNVIRRDIEIGGTSEDFAKHFRQSPVNVRCVISRKYIGKPKRKVIYSFNKFLGIIPDKWLCCKKNLIIRRIAQEKGYFDTNFHASLP